MIAARFAGLGKAAPFTRDTIFRADRTKMFHVKHFGTIGTKILTRANIPYLTKIARHANILP